MIGVGLGIPAAFLALLAVLYWVALPLVSLLLMAVFGIVWGIFFIFIRVVAFNFGKRKGARA